MVRIFIKFSLTSGISDIKIGLKSGNPKEGVLLYGGSGMRCMGNGKQWKPAVAKVIASMVESEQKAKGTWLCTMPDVAFYGLWCVTTATVGQKLKTGRITALGSGSYSYWFRNCGGTGGFCGGSS